jgi:ketosteroid isomerase-like protein
VVVIDERDKAELVSQHFNAILGVPTIDMAALDSCFTKDEVWAIIRTLPPDKAPGLDGFTWPFY